MQARLRVRLLELLRDAHGVHHVSAIRVLDGGDGVGRALVVGWDAGGFERGCQLRVFEPGGLVGDVFVVEDETCPPGVEGICAAGISAGDVEEFDFFSSSHDLSGRILAPGLVELLERRFLG